MRCNHVAVFMARHQSLKPFREEFLKRAAPHEDHLGLYRK